MGDGIRKVQRAGTQTQGTRSTTTQMTCIFALKYLNNSFKVIFETLKPQTLFIVSTWKKWSVHTRFFYFAS